VTREHPAAGGRLLYVKSQRRFGHDSHKDGFATKITKIRFWITKITENKT
jgi:hypothetical protein